MAVVIKMDGAVAASEFEGVALEASLNGLRVIAELRLRAQAVAVASTMLSAHTPPNLGCAASFPVRWLSGWKHLRTMITCRIPHGNFST
jgi:hypothetical protein